MNSKMSLLQGLFLPSKTWVSFEKYGTVKVTEWYEPGSGGWKAVQIAPPDLEKNTPAQYRTVWENATVLFRRETKLGS